jgi:hypothetical protein
LLGQKLFIGTLCLALHAQGTSNLIPFPGTAKSQAAELRARIEAASKLLLQRTSLVKLPKGSELGMVSWLSYDPKAHTAWLFQLGDKADPRLSSSKIIRGIWLEDAADFEPGVAAALAHNGPGLVDAGVNRQELSMPPKITFEIARGFTLYMVKAVMNGPADEIFDDIRTQIRPAKLLPTAT